MDFIEKLPIPVSGLILAILSLGNLLQGYPRILCGVIGVILIISLAFKLIFHPNIVLDDLSNPIILSNSGTFSMSLMLLSTYLFEFNGSLAISIWILGIALHILLIIYFTYQNIIRNFNICGVYPSYWIVFVGITMAAITSPVYGLTNFGFIFFLMGFLSMIITLPLVVFRYLKYPNELNQNKPLICIFTAVISILIVGYVNSSPISSYEFIMVLYAVAFAFFLFALCKVFEYRKLEFYPSYSAFTFPFVITAIASKEVFAINQSPFLNIVVVIQTVIAIILVIYVFWNYLKFFQNP